MSASLLCLPPLSLYIHIPWCLKKCPYCDFNSHASTGELPEKAYIEKLLEDLEQDLSYVQGRNLRSIFIGGGTPSLFAPQSIATLLERISRMITFSDDIEITMEANPGTFETEKFALFRQAGVNRLSIGIQSFDQQFLKKLGRVHDDNEARHAAANVRAAGFENFNLDLMFGLPGQDKAQALADLETALSFEPPHLSWYQLTIEPNTAFYSKTPVLPEDDSIGEMHDAGIDLLAGNDMQRYEVSAFSVPGLPSSHNLNYWQFGDYLGIGAGAHGKITFPEENKILRSRKKRQPENYLKSNDTSTAETLVISRAELPLEFMMNVLRLREGCDAQLFEHYTGLPLATVSDKISLLQDRGLLRQDGICATDKGYLLLNSLLEEFLPSVPQHRDNIALHSLEK